MAQDASPEHEIEQSPVQRNVHVEPPSQLMLPLAPTVTSHSAPASQSTLHDEPHVPVHVL
jgi:hypothetical protein